MLEESFRFRADLGPQRRKILPFRRRRFNLRSARFPCSCSPNVFIHDAFRRFQDLRLRLRDSLGSWLKDERPCTAVKRKSRQRAADSGPGPARVLPSLY